MPHPKAVRGEKVACYCSMPKRPNPHYVSVRTRYRHLNLTGQNGGGSSDGDNGDENNDEFDKNAGDEGEPMNNDDESMENEDDRMEIFDDSVFNYGYDDGRMGYPLDSESSEALTGALPGV
ncbi:hypothetical protein FRC11_012888 [Ceratobasidium sp. 423]|nr:hypothetical protein FRC11_012888 [Ceratobasidium sp. 423]